MAEERNFRREELPEIYYIDRIIKSLKRSTKEVGKELAKIEVSFPRGETLKRGNIRVKDNELNYFYFSF